MIQVLFSKESSRLVKILEELLLDSGLHLKDADLARVLVTRTRLESS